MILRRFMQHVREQNWFAVGLDVLVVIVGIFLGLQVQAWYDNQQSKEREKAYLNNLNEDIETNLSMIKDSLVERDFVEKGLAEILNSYAGHIQISELSSAHCRAVSISHKQANPISELPAAMELISSGSLQIVSNEKIRREISAYLGILDLLRDRRTSTQLFMVDLTGLYPDIIEVDLLNADNLASGKMPNNKCNFENGLNNQQFKNHLAMNAGRQWQLTHSINEQIAALQDLHKLVSQELNAGF